MNRILYLLITLLVSVLLGYNSYSMNFRPQASILFFLKTHIGHFRNLNLSPQPGYPYSLLLGYVGTTLMLLTNILVIAKRVFSVHKGSNHFQRALDFHVFTGLVGPACILFHSNFKFGGIAGGAFWAMIVIVITGSFGEFIYPDILAKQAKFNERLKRALAHLETELKDKKDYQGNPLALTLQTNVLEYSGATSLLSHIDPGTFATLTGTLRGAYNRFSKGNHPDFNLRQVGPFLRNLSNLSFRCMVTNSVQHLTGYWLVIHLPFCFLLLLLSVIHIATGILFGISR